MARIKPFNGVRYNKDKVDYSSVVTQPYDKISPELREKYYARSPYTCCKLILNKASDPYLDAKQNLHEWIEADIVKPDQEASIYAYHQEYQADGAKKVRKGFISLVGLEKFEAKVILPHERTLAGPKVDRLNLLRATGTHYGQIFLLYQDPAKKINSLFATFTAQPADEVVVDDFGDTHSLWKISDPAVIAEVQAIMKDKQLLIADGHHRYATSCNFSEENNQAVPNESAFGYTMATLINMDDEGLTVLPTHRLIHSLPDFDSNQFLTKCAEYFTVTTTHDLDSTLKDLNHKQGKNTFGYYDGKGFHLLTLKDQTIMDTLIGDAHPAVWKKLDVAILHTVILEHILGISKEKQEAQTNLSYARQAFGAYEKVKEGKEQAVFLLNYTSVKEVYDVAQVGDVMPQKSTDFYPKLLSGMVMYKIK